MPGNTFLLPPSYLTGPGKDPQASVVQNDPKHESLTDPSTCSRLVSLSTPSTEASWASCRHCGGPSYRGAPPACRDTLWPSTVSSPKCPQPCQPFLRVFVQSVWSLNWSFMVTWLKWCSMIACMITNNLLGAACALDAWSSSPILQV